ncbi:MAG: S8 family peptidase [Eubacteriaceae bacterium]|nr:S8 family peptidase [Eubacteriaceae bacterium]
MRNRRKNNHISKIDRMVVTMCEGSQDIGVPAIIYVKENAKAALAKKLSELNCQIKYELNLINAVCAVIDPKAVDTLAREEAVLYIAGDTDAKAYMDVAKKAVCGNNQTNRGENVTVAVIDTGVYPHRDLTYRRNRIVGFKDFVNNRQIPYDDSGHGSHCCGIIAGDGTSSRGKYIGIAPDANIIALKALDGSGMGSASDILAAMDWVYNNAEAKNISIVSLSFGAGINPYSRYDPLANAAEKLWDKGLVVVAAAGNEGPSLSTIGTPGASGRIITVGCSDDKRTVPLTDDTIADFSSRGPSAYAKLKPDVVAPGTEIVSLSNNGGYATLSGTSMSAPMVAGCCALLKARNPNMTNNEIKKTIMSSAVSLGRPYNEQGRGTISMRDMNIM